jgi:transposase
MGPLKIKKCFAAGDMFLTGVERDLDAIRNAIAFPYSNGLA